MNVIAGLRNTIKWAQTDFKTNPWRLAGEFYGCTITISTAIIFAFTVPHVPFLFVYPMWITGVIVLMFCAISRGSVGLTLLNLSMLIFDVIGYARLLLNAN
jgi:hypothetical protein